MIDKGDANMQTRDTTLSHPMNIIHNAFFISPYQTVAVTINILGTNNRIAIVLTCQLKKGKSIISCYVFSFSSTHVQTIKMKLSV